MSEMSDLISRDALYHDMTMKPMELHEKDLSWNGFVRGFVFAMEFVNSLSSVEPEPKWIPVTEALPEEREWLGTKRFGTTKSDEIYVTFENPKGERFCKHLSFQNGKLSRFDESTIDAFYPEAKPIAWMPLPEPWGSE